MAALGGLMDKHLPPRWDSTDALYFVTVVTHERYPYFESKEACRTLMDACHSVWGRRNYHCDTKNYHCDTKNAAVEGGATIVIRRTPPWKEALPLGDERIFVMRLTGTNLSQRFNLGAMAEQVHRVIGTNSIVIFEKTSKIPGVLSLKFIT